MNLLMFVAFVGGWSTIAMLWSHGLIVAILSAQFVASAFVATAGLWLWWRRSQQNTRQEVTIPSTDRIATAFAGLIETTAGER